MENKIWIILRPHYSPLGVLEKVGICGTGFFIDNDTFISSYHILNESSFIPNSNYFNKNILIASPEGKKIEITSKNIYKLLPEIDISIMKINGQKEYFETEETYSKNDKVKNFGYPERHSKEIFQILNPENFQVKKQFEQSGRILKIDKNYSINANDVKIFNKKVIILDYSSEMGFSGGPLLKNGKVIGVMSHLYPQNKNVIAISIEEIKKPLNK